MQVDVRIHTDTHYWISAFWCALGVLILGALLVISYWIRRCRKVKHIMKKLHKQNGLKRSNSAIEFDVSALSAANRRHLYSRHRSASSEQDNSDLSEHSEKSPLVSARPNIKYQYSALDSGNGIVERSPRERAQRERALNATQEWILNCNGRYEVLVHLDEIGSRHGKHWFLVTDASVRTDRLLTLLPIPSDCVAFEDLPLADNPKAMLMELLGSLHHPYVYPVLDLGFIRATANSTNYACLVTPFNSRGSLKDLIYKTQWNEPWARKYTRKPTGLPVTQIQRLGRQILEALLFLKERGFPLHGHLHSGNVILQNGAARLSGLENGLLGLSSRINAIMWSRSTTEIENVDIICFGHLLYEMCTGQEMTTPKPSMRVLEMELDNFPQILDVLGLIFEPPSGVCPSVEDLVLCDLFRSIDLRELRGPCFNTIKPSLSRSTLNLLHAVKKRQCATLGNSLSETCTPCSPPTTPHDRITGYSRTMHSFDLASDSEEALLEEIVVGGAGNYLQLNSHARSLLGYKQHQHHYEAIASTSSACYVQRQHQQPHWHAKQPQEYHQQYYDATDSPIHYCDNATHDTDDNSYASTYDYQQQHEKHEHQYPKTKQPQQQHPLIYCSSSTSSNLNVMLDGGGNQSTAASPEQRAGNELTMPLTDNKAVDSVTGQLELDEQQQPSGSSATTQPPHATATAHGSLAACAGAAFNHQLTADMCNYKNSKSRRLEYSLKCLKYGRSNPSQDSAFGSLTDNDLSIGSTSFRLSSFQSISSPIDEGVEDVIIATTTAGKETCLELATIPRNMISQDSAISSPCRETSPCQFLNVDDGLLSAGSCSAASSSSSSVGNMRPQHFPASLSPKILVTATTNSSNSSLASLTNPAANDDDDEDIEAAGALSTQQQTQQASAVVTPQPPPFEPPKILVNDQNSIYTTSPSKRFGTIEVFSQKYRVSSYEDMSPNKRADKQHLKHANRLAFRSLEEERRIDNAFIPIGERTTSDQRVNMQSEKYKKLTHSSFRISKTASQVTVCDNATVVALASGTPTVGELQRPATASGSIRQTMWRDSKFYRKNHIAKSNDSLLETSPNHSARLSPASLRDNQYDSSSSYGGSRSHSRQSLNRGGSVNEFKGSNQTLGFGLAVTANYFGNSPGGGVGRRYCSSKSEDLGETGSNDYLRVMDARKSYSERHLVTLNKLKQTAINNTNGGSTECCLSEDEMSFNDDNNLQRYQHEYHYQQEQQQQQQQHHQQRLYHYQQQQQQLILQQHQHQQQQHQAAHFTNLFYKRPHPQQLSWSACSINHLKTTNIKTTSLSTLPACSTNLSEAPSTLHLTADDNATTTTGTSPQSTSTNTLSSLEHHKSNNHLAVLTNGDYLAISSAQDSSCSGNSLGGHSSGTTTCDTADTEENSSPEDSPSHRTLSGMELSKIFATDASSCSEEKTPLLDSVELSPISPTDALDEMDKP